MRDHVSLFVNGKLHQVTGADAFLSLAEFLRTQLALTGTKVVCAEGDCGSCTVLCGRASNGQFNYLPVDSCILFVFQLDGAHVITVEGLSRNGQLTPVQQAMIDHHGSQCGFCTPGFVMAMTALASESPGGGGIDWRAGLTGNLCRCTGYTPILAAGCAVEGTPLTSLNETYPPQSMLSIVAELADESFEVVDHSVKPPRHAVGPIELPNVIGELGRFPGAALVAGATDLGVQVNKGKWAPQAFIDLNRIRELELIELTRTGDTRHLVMGARVTWTQLAAVIEQEVPELHHIISIFGSPQIRHVGTIGGNLANASPIADSIPFLMVMEAELELVGPQGSRVVNINDFYQGYKQLDLRLEELIAQVHFTLPRPEEVVRLVKVSRRRDLDISTLTAAIRMQIEDGRIRQPAIALGGVGPTAIRVPQTELSLDGRALTEDAMRQAGEIACGEIAPISDVRGSAEFRYQLTRNVFLKFFHDARPWQHGQPGAVMNSVGKPIPHDSAVGHVTGRAPYIEDIPRRDDELWVSFVGSPVAAGRIVTLDLEPALQIDGVVDALSHVDIPGKNLFGAVLCDEPFLAHDRLLYLGQPVAVIAAETRKALSAAQSAVVMEVEQAEPVLSITEARAQDRFIGPARCIARGDVDGALKNAPKRLSGTFHIGGQEQFYLESQAALALPDEDGQIIVHSSTQNTTEIQAVVADILGVGQHQVVCICKRMGGAFGGKETQAALPAVMAAIVAYRTGRSGRVIYDKDLDMQVTGKRHAYDADWEVGFDERGSICALRFDFFSNGGAAADLSTSVMERTMLHAENSYFIPNIEINGRVCFTNLPPNTAFRGFGGPQAMVAMENVIHEVANHLRLDPYDIQLTNLYGTDHRNITPYGQEFKRNHLPEIVAQLAESCQYKQRLAAIETANQASTLTLRGIALTPIKFGIAFTSSFLNQGNAIVNVYTDGTVQVSTGGTEMGQGLNTKIRQLVADEFGLSWKDVRLMSTSTEKNNNTSPTAASAGTDLNGAAAVEACRQIRARLRPFAAEQLAAKSGNETSVKHVCFVEGQVYDARDPARQLAFGQLTDAARRARIDLGARAFYATPGVDFDRETGQGTPFFYFTQGAAVAEVEIDRFTGDLTVPRVDVLIDIGRSINPGVDMGQITGGFVQGMGWVTAECLVYDSTEALLSHSPTTYKIPAVTDLPPVFNCALFENDDNVENVARSKAVGEPPLMLAIAVWSAVKHAINRSNPAGSAALRLPATNEEILRCIELKAAKPVHECS